MTPGEVLGIVLGGYGAVWVLAYRWQFKRMYRRFRAWQLEAPNKVEKWYTEYGWGFPSATRKDFSFKNWFQVTDGGYNHQSHEFPPAYTWAWPLLTLFFGGKFMWERVLQPFVQPTGEPKALKSKVDYAQIEKMEKELGIED